MKKIGGVIPALFTPFAADGSVNSEQLKKLIEFNLAKGASGFYVNGSSAEVFLLTEEERKGVYKTVKETVGDRGVCIAHVGSISTKQAIDYAKYAAELKYDAISAVTPFYFNFTNKEILKYYFDIVDASGMPLLVYNIPALSGVELSYDDLCTLLSDERIVGVKYTSSDFFKLQRIRNKFPDKIILNGYDEMFAAGLMSGADGGIGSSYNFMAEKYIELYRAFRANDTAQVQKMQNEINLVVAEAMKHGFMQSCKAILDSMGFEMGGCRPPFDVLAEDEKKILLDAVAPILA